MGRSSRLILALSAAAIAGVVAVSAAPSPVDTDREAIKEAVGALYAVISGPAGQERDWDAMRGMFTPTGRLTAMVREIESGNPRQFEMTVDEYIETSGAALTARGFREHEIASRTEVFGTIAHVWTTYEGFVDGGEEPFVRGINSIQLVKVGGEWKIATVLWDSEREGQAIPTEYLPGE